MDVLSLIKQTLITDNSNPITKHFELGKQVASGGTSMVWKVYDANRIKDRQRASVFIFEKKVAEKMHRPRRKDIVTEILRKEIRIMTGLRHSKILKVLHPIEECHDSLAFAVEPVFASLANVLGNHERLPSSIPSEIKEHKFIETEIKCGILQVTDALSYLHNTQRMLHMNICPSSIFITSRGVWKLGGFGFSERSVENSITLQVPVVPWSPKQHKMAQPDLDYIAPEIQLEAATCATPASDMFSLGMVVCAIYNGGKSLIQAAHLQSAYLKQVDRMTELFGEVAHKMPLDLVEPVEKMINNFP